MRISLPTALSSGGSKSRNRIRAFTLYLGFVGQTTVAGHVLCRSSRRYLPTCVSISSSKTGDGSRANPSYTSAKPIKRSVNAFERFIGMSAETGVPTPAARSFFC